MAASHTSGPIVETGVNNSQDAARGSARSCVSFLGPPIAHFPNAGGAITQVTNAAGDYSLTRAAGAGSPILVVPISAALLLQTAPTAAETQINMRSRGPRINSFDCVYRIGVANLTSITPTFKTTTYTDGAAISITDRPVTPTPLAAGDISFHATNMQRVRITVTTPIVIDDTMNASLNLAIVLPGTSTFEWHGCFVNYDILV